MDAQEPASASQSVDGANTQQSPALTAGAKASGFTRRLLLAMLVINLMVLAFVAWALYESRLKSNDRAVTQASNIALLVDHDIANALLNVDLTLKVTVEELMGYWDVAHAKPREIGRFLDQQLIQTPDLEGILLTDASGRVRFGTGARANSRADISDRRYFHLLRAMPDRGVVLDGPFVGRIAGKQVIILARALQNRDGAFAGVVAGAISLERLGKAITSLQLGPGGTFTLFNDERRIVMRYQDGLFRDALIGTELRSPQLRALMSEGRTEGNYLIHSTVDGVERMFSYRNIKGQPWHISIGIASSDYLIGWYEEVLRALALVLLFVFATLMLSWFIYRAWKQQAVTLAALRDAIRTRDAEKQLSQTIFQSSPFAIFTRDRHGIVTAWNPAAEQLFGWTASEALGKPLLAVPAESERLSLEVRERILRGERLVQSEVKARKLDGTLFDLSITLAPLHNPAGEVEGFLAIAADITGRKAAEQQIEFLAYRDVLTGLPNRLLLVDRFKQALLQAERADSKVALLFIDLDNFKTINDSLGHFVGDALLKEVAYRLSTCVRDTDTISRQGGDEFLIVLSDLRNVDAVTPVLTKIRERLQAPVEFDGNELTTSASIGVALYPDDGKDFDVLLKKADTAMYRAKDAGRNQYRYFDEQMNVEAVEHLQLKNGLRRALAQKEFELHYQPQFDLRSGAVTGA